jgi:hypothetical protein
MLKNVEIYFTQSINQQNISNQPGAALETGKKWGLNVATEV